MTRYAHWTDGLSITPIEIRRGLIVRIVGMPLDMTKAEAEKISRVVLAHATATAKDDR